MAVTDTIKDAVGLGDGGPKTRTTPASSTTTSAQRQQVWLGRTLTLKVITEATREEMSAARLPLAYRDSCAHLLIPLNRCRHNEYYLPWRCEVCTVHERVRTAWKKNAQSGYRWRYGRHGTGLG